VTTTTLGYALFATRWLQAPLYFGLVAAQGVYVYKFFYELWTLVVRCVSGQATETFVMLAVLKLVDVVMIANLLITVIHMAFIGSAAILAYMSGPMAAQALHREKADHTIAPSTRPAEHPAPIPAQAAAPAVPRTSDRHMWWSDLTARPGRQAWSSASSATPVIRCSGNVRTSSAVWSYAVTKPPSTRTGAMTRWLAAPSALT
jgi:hypothetical protein